MCTSWYLQKAQTPVKGRAKIQSANDTLDKIWDPGKLIKCYWLQKTKTPIRKDELEWIEDK